MTDTHLEPIQAEDLLIQVEEAPKRVVLRWTGRSNARDPGKLLKPWFDRLLRTAQEHHQSVEMHFERLELFNSSTIAALIQIINTARLLGIPLTIHYDAELRWQALSFDALKRALKPFESDAKGAKVEFVHAPRH